MDGSVRYGYGFHSKKSPWAYPFMPVATKNQMSLVELKTASDVNKYYDEQKLEDFSYPEEKEVAEDLAQL